jgi:hypothetical protein
MVCDSSAGFELVVSDKFCNRTAKGSVGKDALQVRKPVLRTCNIELRLWESRPEFDYSLGRPENLIARSVNSLYCSGILLTRVRLTLQTTYQSDAPGMKFKDLSRHLQPAEGLHPENWHQHPNGRGWVENTAKVDRTAYVGPNAIVMDEARIVGSAKIKGNARVGGSALVEDSTIDGRAEVNEMAKILKNSEVTGNTFIGGYAVLVGESCDSGQLRPWTNVARAAWRQADSGRAMG